MMLIYKEWKNYECADLNALQNARELKNQERLHLRDPSGKKFQSCFQMILGYPDITCLSQYSLSLSPRSQLAKRLFQQSENSDIFELMVQQSVFSVSIKSTTRHKSSQQNQIHSLPILKDMDVGISNVLFLQLSEIPGFFLEGSTFILFIHLPQTIATGIDNKIIKAIYLD